MRAWWSGRSAREQALIAIAAAIFAVFLLLQAVVKPIADWKEAAAGRAAEAESGYRLVARAASATVPPREADGAEVPLRNAVIDTGRALQVGLTFVNARPDGSVEFQAGPVAPERVFSLFAALQSRYGAKVVSADIARSPESIDQVRLQATIVK
ncbi:MAG: type II secretion system protein GspM [Parvularculaceae bacterium]